MAVESLFKNNKYFNPYEGVSKLATGALDQGLMAAEAFRDYDINGREAPSIDDGSLYLDTSFYRDNLGQARALRSDAKDDVGSNVLRGVASGATAGSAFGLPGAAIGAGVGAIGGVVSGLFSSGKKKREARRTERDSREDLSSYLQNFNRASENQAQQLASNDRLNQIISSYRDPTSLYF